MASGTLYGNAENPSTQKVLAAAKYGGAALKTKNEPPPQDKFFCPATPAYEDGKKTLQGATAISWLVGGEQLKGQNKELVPEVLQWLQFSEGTLHSDVMAVVLPSLSLAPHDKKAHDGAKGELEKVLSVMDEYLLSRTFFVAERISHADISLAFDLLPAYQHVFEASTRDKYTNLTRWFNTIVNQPEVKAVLGDVKLCDKAAQFDGKKFKENQAKIAAVAGTSSEQKTPKKKEQQPKQEKAKKKKEEEPAEEADETEKAMAQEPKQADPFAAIPKGTFNMDDFKRVYSNEDTIEKALPYFWENFDSENYSIWYSEYKFPKELSLVFMSCNLIGGMFQRLEKLKKNAFGSVCLFGSDNNSTISGIWVWRGHELVFTLSPDWQVDFESYEWTKLDYHDEKTKKLVNEYFAWEGDFDGKKFNQGKIFK